jgi:hypothetical protein
VNDVVHELVELNDTIAVAVKLAEELLQVPAVTANLKLDEHGLQLISAKHSVVVCVELLEDGS